ncbi:MAG: polysulfide reductase NrfD [Deltaproteobacteria bacterium]|nr:polysulfide reductase NrfD [Deltaproteobacteria bacterium]
MTRINKFKAVMWFLVGFGAAVGIARFLSGLGATTNLTDLTPWGFWIGFDVMGGVALAAGGFVVAAVVYVFHLKEFKPISRAAVLTAFLGYVAVVGGLLFDLGLPWNIWHMIVYWNPGSPLFEVGWCVMLYTTVLALEFAPVVLEMANHPILGRIHGFLKRFTLPLVILGIMLSTLHQSSLGSLALIMPHRLPPLYYTPILPVLFFISAVGLGLMVVMVEASVTSYLYQREQETDLLAKLGKGASAVLWLYFVVRIGELAVSGELGLLWEGSFTSNLYIVELLLSTVVPALLFLHPRVSGSAGGLFSAAVIGVLGFVLNRTAVAGLAMQAGIGDHYFPSWMEFAVSFAIVAAAALAFMFLAERLKVWEKPALSPSDFSKAAPLLEPNGELWVPDPAAGIYMGRPARLSLAFVIGAALAFAISPSRAFESAEPVPSPARPALVSSAVMVIDGDRDGDFVQFEHNRHIAFMGDDASCGKCHHMRLPKSKAGPCADCHRDMDGQTDIFNHDEHASGLGGNKGCMTCHIDPYKPKTRAVAGRCFECHGDMVAKGSRVKLKNESFAVPAPSYRNAMHKMCITCHQEKAAKNPALKGLDQCANCHRVTPGASDPKHPDFVPAFKERYKAQDQETGHPI